MKTYSKSWKKGFTAFDLDAQRALLSYAWPGNVSELKAVVQKVVADHDGSTVQLHHLPLELSCKLSEFPRHCKADRRAGASVSRSSAHPPEGVTETAIKPLWQCEREIIEAAITSFQGNISMAAAALEVSPSTIYRKRRSWRNLKDRSFKELRSEKSVSRQ